MKSSRSEATTSITAGAEKVRWRPRITVPLAAACLTALRGIIVAPGRTWGSGRGGARRLDELGQEEVGVLLDHGSRRDAEGLDVGREVHLHPLGLEEFIGFRLVLHRVVAQEVVGVAARARERLLLVGGEAVVELGI